MRWVAGVTVVLWVTAIACASGAQVVFSCAFSNDLYSAVGGERFDTPLEAIERTDGGGAALILADGYPARGVDVPAEALELARRAHLRLYIELPAAAPGLNRGDAMRATWGRAGILD